MTWRRFLPPVLRRRKRRLDVPDSPEIWAPGDLAECIEPEDIRDIYAEAKAVGYDTKIMRQIVRLRRMDPHERREMDPPA